MRERASDVKYMRGYLRHAIEFEKYAYLWTEALNSVNSRIHEEEQERQQQDAVRSEAKTKLNTMDSSYEQYQRKIQTEFDEANKKRRKSFRRGIIATLLVTLFMIIITKDGLSEYPPEGRIIMFLLECGTLIAFFFGGWYNIFYSTKKARCAEIKGELKRISSGEPKKKDIATYTAQLENAERSHALTVSKLNGLTVQKTAITNALTNAQRNLKGFYAENVLPSRYRSFSAVATLCQYLENGICTAVVGHGGIYDTYETHLLQKIIIGNLNEIRNSLSRIEMNQHRLYHAVMDANRLLRNINGSLNEIQESVVDIERSARETSFNTAVGAAAQMQTAASAEYLEWRARMQ